MSERVSVFVPATCANLGCLFDCGAIALNLYVNIHITPRADKEIEVFHHGVHAERVCSGPDNLIARTLQETLQGWGITHGFDVDIENQIPVGVGLGSSAAAIVGALAASHVLADRPLCDEEFVALATEHEGHPDNVAAAWHGGFTVAAQMNGRVLTQSCPLPESLGMVLVIPDYPLPTEEARKVLPDYYSRPDAVNNLQRAAVLTAQLFSGKTDFHRTFFDDRWHQPYRARLVPGLSEALDLEHPDLLGICLSGSGPSILAFTRGNASAVGELIQRALAEKQVRTDVHVVTADNRGAKGWIMPV